MFGAFRPSLVAQGGLLWKNPFRMSATLIAAVKASGVQCKALDEALVLPKELK
ncbi:unnamed protein product [Cunninghamella echinulata]